ncbi:DinB family protein [Serinibacter arcticus]|uniref:Type I restriction-modification system methyltransferase subunit n=1 Tax=Serinibacter arcticus TaxID=1655435 RepID=A0A4Z1E2Z2_9MICO|nr:DinB family protein [Serinibacter arcticus]TGO05620.1 Type I restriction-modification system methyltransferase subunit [Serinibacter arcticus]
MGDNDAVRDEAVEKELLNRYLRKARRELLATLDGLSQEQIRWPMTGTGTNLLGLVKHVASVEIDYFGAVFGRPSPTLPWMADDAPVNADMWATEEESRASILELHAESVRIAEATIAELGLDAAGHVPWWGERGAVTLRQILVHVGFEVSRHAGHADIVRELIDGRAGSGDGNLPELEVKQWANHRERLEEAATAAAARWAEVEGP